MKLAPHATGLLASPSWDAGLPAETVEQIKAVAAELGASPADVLAGKCGHSLTLIPTESAKRLRDVEHAAGLPPGTIAAKFIGALVASWTQATPGSLSRWVDRHFVFGGTVDERAAIGAALFRLESQWRREK
jgi:hypothetical protein